ncbi:MAG: NAD(P)-dependent oxidoreductase [Candidatus Woesearchaeota archaeon]
MVAKKPSITFFELEPWEKDFFTEVLKGYRLRFFDKPIDKDSAKAAADSDALGIFVYDKINKPILKLMPKLKLIATLSTGYDHIDLKECARRGITVCNVPGYGETAVAEHTFALILALTRKIIDSVERTRRGNFSLDGLRGIEIYGKTIGIIGTGRIGKAVVRIAKGFGMRVIAYDPYPDIEYAKQMGFEYKRSLEDVMKEADILTLHAVYTPKTHHMINKANIGKLKKGAILINTARGGLVATEAILEGLKKGILSGVGLDVLEEECLIKEEKELLSGVFSSKVCDLKTAYQEHVLLAQDNVIITPHNAFNTTEALQRILNTTLQNIKGFFAGKPTNVVKA